MAKYALDCEMVGSYNSSLLARVTIVNQHGQVVLDEYVKPTAQVTDYRSCYSGIKRSNLVNGLDKSVVRNKVANILRGNILIGHSLHFDLQALELTHPERNQRDLAKFEPYMSGGQPVALKTLAMRHLGKSIQNSEHDSVEDARASMDLYLNVAPQWERNY